MYDIVIIGGGASGLACAIRAKQLNQGLSVLIIEASERLGKKIALTGNGQGNLSNGDMSAAHFHGSCVHLAEKILQSQNPLTLFDFLTIQDKLGRIYPAGKQASAISDSLICTANSLDIKVLFSVSVTAVKRRENGFLLSLSGGHLAEGKRIVMAFGGKAQKQLNTDGSAFAIAKSLGHSVTKLCPSLVQLKCPGGFKPLKGIRVNGAVTVFASGDKVYSVNGDIIFTDYGLSGNAVFYASAYCTDKKNVTLSLDLLPEFSEEEIANIINLRLSRGYPIAETLGGTMHNTVGRFVIRSCQDPTPENIAHTVKNFTAEVEGSLGWDYAQVTKGGIPYSEVTDGLESKLCPGLYFAGEALDIDGDCGGYNLHFAFASGMYAAESVVEGLKQ